jgi:hypothetical protein
VGRNSSVGIATGYGLDGPGIESRWGDKIFRACPDRSWGPPSLLYNGYRVFPGVKKRTGSDADTSPPSSAVGHEWVELYLCSPCGSYGLYRASVPVQGCTLSYYKNWLKQLCDTVKKLDWLQVGRSGDRIPVGGEIFRTCPDRPWGPPSLLYNRYRVFPVVKERPGRDADPSLPSSAVVKKQ